MKKTINSWTQIEHAERGITITLRGVVETYWLLGVVPVMKIYKMTDWKVENEFENQFSQLASQ